MSKTNIISLNWNLWKHFIQEKKKAKIEKHSTKTFYVALYIAIEKCKKHPRKYYIVKKNSAEWEILGSQELKKMRKFSVAKSDKTFMDLHELAPYVSPENIKRHIHEQRRRKWHVRWWNMLIENYYKPVTKGELELLKQIGRHLSGDIGYSRMQLNSSLTGFIKKHS